MGDLSILPPPIPRTALTRYKGVVVLTAGVLGVNVNGNVIPVSYADPVVISVGDAVIVDIFTGATGQSEAIVTGRLTLTPRPATGTVKTVPVGSTTITVTGTDSIDYTASFVSSYTPTVSDNVILAWNAATPTVTGKVGTTATPTAPPPSGVAPPPGQSGSGTSYYPATDSDTIWPAGGWGSWAGGGGHVYQGGSAYGGPVYGAWFYAGATGELSGRTLTRIQFRLGARRSVGDYNAAVTVHFYTHTSPSKPGGDVTRTTGPFDVSIPAGWGGGVIDLPTTFAGALAGGGGISIAGESYAGVEGRYTQADSGTLTINWTR